MADDIRPTAGFWQRATAALSWPLTPADYFGVLAAASDRAEVLDITPAAPGAATLTLRPPRGYPRHRAGQYVQIGVDIDGVRHHRCYSISSAPERRDGCLTLTVKAVDGGRVSRHLVEGLRPGARLTLAAPAGDFMLPEACTAPLLLIAAGSGITPVMSMLASLDARGAMPPLTLIYSAPEAGQMIFAAELAALAARHPQLRFEPVYSRAQGRLDPQRIEALCPDWRRRQTFACGPDALLQRLEAHWAGAGAVLHVERFRARRAPAADSAGGRVQFLRSARSACGRPDQSLLELAEASGLAPAHGCRMGICHGCIVPLHSGAVRDLRSGQTFSEAGEPVQICVCAPVGEVEIEL